MKPPATKQILGDVYGAEADAHGLVDVQFSLDGPRRATVWTTFVTPPEKGCAFIALTQSRLLCSSADATTCAEGFETSGRFRGAEIGVALYEGAVGQFRLVAKNPVVADWGNWNKPPRKDTVQVVWLRQNVALIASSSMLSGPTMLDSKGDNLVCYSSNKRLLGILVGPNLMKEALDVVVNSFAIPCSGKALSTALFNLNGSLTAIEPTTTQSTSLPNLEIMGMESQGTVGVVFRRIECSFSQAKYNCAGR